MVIKNDLHRMVREMGYLADSGGVINRYIESAGAWDSHLTNCKEFVLKAVSGKAIKNLAVYGSGWLLDFPLDQVAAMVNNIVLYDLVHPPQVLHKIKKHPNVKAITADLTGGSLEEAFGIVKIYAGTGKMPAIESIFNCRFIPETEPDFCISVNLLSQIGDLVTEYIMRHTSATGNEISELTRKLQQQHIELLKPGHSCLITDVKESYYDLEDTPRGIKEIIKCSLPLAKRSEGWEWQFDLSGDYVPGLKTISTVVAMEI